MKVKESLNEYGEDSGGPAFPNLPNYSKQGEIHDGSYGMTLRDYFAAKAMQGLLTAKHEATWEQLAEAAYKQADAMLEGRTIFAGRVK